MVVHRVRAVRSFHAVSAQTASMDDHPLLPRYPRTSADVVAGRPKPTSRFRRTSGALMVLALAPLAAAVVLIGSTSGQRGHRGRLESAVGLTAVGIFFLGVAAVYLGYAARTSRRPGVSG